MRALVQDLMLGFRTLKKEPASAVIASLTLALGIGACTLAFSLVYGVFFRGLDVPEANRLILIYRTVPSRDVDFMGVNSHDLYDWRAQQTSFEGLAMFETGTVNVSGVEGPERYDGAFVSANLFDLLRVRPLLGSGFRPGDDAAKAPLTVVLGYRAWQTRYEEDPDVVGRSVTVNGEAATILGVMPAGFQFPSDQELWVASRDSRADEPNRDRANTFNVFGRLNDGVSLDQASAEMALIAQRLADEHPESNEGVTTRFRTFVEDDTGPELRAVFGAMQVATIFVLLIACANVANLLLARATLRTRESAVRTALGASRWRVVLPFFAETLLLAVAGAVAGVVIAYVGVTLFDGATQTVGKPYYMRFALDAPVLAFVVGVTVVTALVAGAAPAFQVLRTDVNATLKDETRGSSGILGGRVTRALVMAEIALSCALLIGAGLMVKSIAKLGSFDFPFATENVFTARLGLFETDYPDRESRQALFTRLEERLLGIPGARAVSLSTSLPPSAGTWRIGIEGETYARAQDYPTAENIAVTPRFFETFEVPVDRGRMFTEQDAWEGEPVAMVNQPFADRFFPGTDPIGRRFKEGTSDSNVTWITIVGIVPDMRLDNFEPETHPAGFFRPLAQRDARFVNVAVNTSRADPLGMTREVRDAVRSLDPNLPIYDVATEQGFIDQRMWFYRVFGTVFITVGAVALFMATVGLYGVLSFSVSRRVKEMGIRMALGATGRDVVRLVLRQGGMQILVGLSIGLVLAYGLTRVIGILMFETTPQDPPVFTIVVAVITVVGLLASVIPARRATQVDPGVALRYE
jgi:putative ABC transport system permease protein